MDGPLEVRALTKRFGEVVALDGIDLSVSPGRLVGFLGPNGAGKTTTMRAILRLVTIDGGSITWGGVPVGESERKRIGYLPQERGLYVRMRVHEQIAYFARLAGVPRAQADARADRWVERVGLADRRNDPVQALSVGNQQRVQLAVALVHQPDLLLLDEPFAGLDPVAVATLRDIIREQVADGVGVVFSSHQLDLVQDLCRDVVIVADGRTIATGAVDELRAASPDRIVDISWRDRCTTWSPEGLGARDLGSTPGHTLLAVDAATDPSGVLAAAASHGEVTSVSFTPPGLEQVFVELVAAAGVSVVPTPAGGGRPPAGPAS